VSCQEEEIAADCDEQTSYMAVSLRKSPYMSVQEDRYTFQENIQYAPYNAFYAVFDGHAGS
jgi:serine/threonine protein phosphatase PrpC